MAALVAVVGWISASPGGPGPRASVAIERHTLAGLRQAFATRALHNAVEAYRLGRGEWPERLEDLERVGLVGPGTLATPEGRPYYPLHREQGLTFLAPER